MMHSMILMAVVSALWMVFGYSMAFGEGNAFFGSPTQYFMLNGVGGAPNTDYAATIPHTTFMLFQLMFAIITPALISGAVAERIKFSVPHGLGQGRIVQLGTRRKNPRAGFRGRNCGACQLRRGGFGGGDGSGQAHGLSARADGAA
jgi:hypothetical protein